MNFGEGCPHIRKLVDYGTVEGYQDLFSYLTYDSFADEFKMRVKDSNFLPFWEQACSALEFIHSKRKN